MDRKHLITLSEKDMNYDFLPSGDIFSFQCGKFMVNQFRGNLKDGSANNIYLRIYEEEGVSYYPLLGSKSASTLSSTSKALYYTGKVQGISYQVAFRPVNHLWFWTVTLQGTDAQVDLIYGQDLGMAEAGAIFSNELYQSQYLDHAIYESPEGGYIICSRQNLPSAGLNPYIQQGVIGTKAIHYSTDGLQFFGLSYKESNQPEILNRDLQDYNLQYEFAYTALQTDKFILNGVHVISFYGLFIPDHPDAVRTLEYQDLIQEAYVTAHYPSGELSASTATQLPPVKIKKEFGQPYSSPSFSEEEIKSLYPRRYLEEYQEDTLLSFFKEDYAHVVTKAKELLTTRPHGTIIITPPDRESISSDLISSTQYMYGIFNSHVVLGNTDFHKLLSTPRGFLNLLKNSGQRIYVKLEGCYRLLTLPAVYEMGMNYSRWFYKLPGDVLIITAYTSRDQADVTLELTSRTGISYDYIITHQVSLGSNEFTHEVKYSFIPDGIRFRLESDEYPGLHYDITLPGESPDISDDRIFYEDERSYDSSFLTLELKQKAAFRLVISASLTERKEVREELHCFEEEKKAVEDYYRILINHFHLQDEKSDDSILQLNVTAWWYAHNAMIHFAMPHGLEQPGGAAWGTRDICQGPLEFFLSTQNYKLVRQILLNIFSHQSMQSSEWPQWFMFDRYTTNAGECHGDVIFWPLKSVADYILASGDSSILEEPLPYLDQPDFKENLISHISRSVSCIKHSRMIQDTGLITYAGGDWDDTLQPANEELKTKLVSAWTEALAYQTFTVLSEALAASYHSLSDELKELAAKVKKAFQEILIQEGIIAGFLECDKTYRYMLHPADDTTGIKYRLIPMTRSIIAELVDQEQAVRNIDTIKSNLKFPDGVRLMSRPARYDGGVSHLFKRAEQAANVGREISLQYTHAHIRYIEALAKLGDSREAWDSLFNINPVRIRHYVPNAEIRQSNLYFSSSDGAFPDRYEYDKHFELLKTGEIGVKGGWRLYSSGPGIYFRQLVGNLLGIRFCKDGLVIDPVLPKELDGLTFTYDCFGRTLQFTYHIGEEYATHAECDSRRIPYSRIANPYRTGGIVIKETDLGACSDKITVYAPFYATERKLQP